MTTANTLNTLLAEGLKTLKLDLGIISNIYGETYKVHLCEKNADERKTIVVSSGDQFELAQSYCTDVIKENATKFYDDVADISEMLKHPCYLTTQLRAYIGTPVHVRGEIWGTLNYSSLVPRTALYSPTDIHFLETQAARCGEILSDQI